MYFSIPGILLSRDRGLSLPSVPVAPIRQTQRLAHGGGGHVLGSGVQMGVDVHGGADVAVAQPRLDQLQIDAVLQQQRGAAVADLVETDLPQSVLFQQGKESETMLGR